MAADVVPCPSCGTKNRVPVASTGTPRCANCHHDLPWLVNVTDQGFDAAVDTKRLVLVDLWAPWCGPCRMVAPILEKLAIDLSDELKVVKVNVDESPETSRRYQASSIPMMLFLRDGDLVDELVGAHPEHVIHERIGALRAAS